MYGVRQDVETADTKRADEVREWRALVLSYVLLICFEELAEKNPELIFCFEV